METPGFVLFIDTKYKEQLHEHLRDRGWRVYEIDGTQVHSIEAFFSWVQKNLPQDPPLLGANFDGLIDSLWGGLYRDGVDRNAIIWSDSCSIRRAQRFDVLTECFEDLGRGLASGKFGMKQPILLRLIFLGKGAGFIEMNWNDEA